MGDGISDLVRRGEGWASHPQRIEAEGLCSDCPWPGYPTDKTRCEKCPYRAQDRSGK